MTDEIKPPVVGRPVFRLRDLTHAVYQNVRSFGTNVASTYVQHMLNIVAARIEAGDIVRLPGIGVFKTYKASARFGFNPTTKTKTNIPEMTRVKFTVDPQLLSKLNS